MEFFTASRCVMALLAVSIGSVVGQERAAGDLVTKSARYHLTSNAGELVALSRTNGRELWRTSTPAKDFGGELLREVNGVVLLKYCFSAAIISCHTVAFDVRTGKIRWNENGEYVAASGPWLLFDTSWVVRAYTGPDANLLLTYDVIDSRSDRVTPVKFTVTPRKNCGEWVWFSEKDESANPTRETFDQRYVSVKLQDNCGVFVKKHVWSK